MNKIYQAVAELRSQFKKMSFAFTTVENDIDNAVQELMLYFLQMNPKTLKDIYEKDGKEGLIRYGAVALRRSFTSKRSNFHYTYNKYYTNLCGIYMTNTKKDNFHRSIYNLPEEVLEFNKYEQLEKIDKVLDNLDYWYDREIFKLYYYDGNTLDSLAKKTGISRNSLFTTIDKVRNKIKEEVE
tara:strand:- start:301 stop:849 length:549 start_codon:yes stop_codon:yes gene_type:complete